MCVRARRKSFRLTFVSHYCCIFSTITAALSLLLLLSVTAVTAAVVLLSICRCKRAVTSDEYLPAFNRDNVTLITDPITSVGKNSVSTDKGNNPHVYG